MFDLLRLPRRSRRIITARPLPTLKLLHHNVGIGKTFDLSRYSFKNIPNLEHLTLSGDVNNVDLSLIEGAKEGYLKSLKCLSVECDSLTGECLQKQTSLKSLAFSMSENFDENHLASLPKGIEEIEFIEIDNLALESIRSI